MTLLKKNWKKVLAIFAAGALASVALACGGDDDESDSGEVAGVAEAESWDTTTPEATGPLDTATWALPKGEPSTLDYLQAAAPSENQVLSAVCEGLLRTNPDLSTEPSLAEEVEHPNDTTYIYKLREGVNFTNGDPMTADDVVFSLSRNLDPDSGTFWSDWFVNVEDIRATDPMTVEVTLTQPDVVFNQFMGTAAGTVVQRDYVEEQGSKYGSAEGGVMCTGPFELTDWTPGDSITIERNDDYWDSGNLAKTESIEFVFLTDASALGAALQAGEVDGAYDVPVTVTTSDAGTVYLGRSTQNVIANYETTPGPIQDVRIREAMSLMVDRDAIAKTIFKDSAIGMFSFYPPATWSYARDTFEQQLEELPSPNTIDLEKAKMLVQEYVQDEGEVRELEMLIDGNDPSQQQLGVYIQSQAEQAGIPMNVVGLTGKQYEATAFDPDLRAEFDVITGFGYVDIADPIVQTIWQLTPDGAFNDFGYDNPEVTALIDEARQTSDGEARADLLGQVADIAYGQDQVAMMIANPAERLFLGNRVAGPPASLPGFLYYPWARDLGAAGG